MNSLFSQQGSWVGDGAKASTITKNESSTITIESETESTPFSTMFNVQSLTAIDSFFYEVTLSSITGSVSVGLVKEENFKKGWKIRGLFYNGNVHDGSAALINSFGDYPKEGDKLGVYLRRDPSSADLLVAFYINGLCIGTAFQLSGTDAKNDIYYPCISVSGGATIDYGAPEFVPSVITREVPVFTDYTGEWKLVQAFAGPELGQYPLPSKGNIIFSFGDFTDGEYPLRISMVNTVATSVAVVGKLDSFDAIKIDEHLMSTMMAPLEPWDEVESFIEDSLLDLRKMIIESKTLIMSGPTSEFALERYVNTFDPITTLGRGGLGRGGY